MTRELHPREVRAEAPVEAARERDVALRCAIEVDGERVVESVAVEVGRGPAHGELVARLDLLARDLEVGSGVATAGDDRRLVPHELLDGGGEQRRVVEQALLLVGMARQPVDHARERRGDGVEAGEHEEERDVDDVLARVSVSPSTSAVMNPPMRSSPGTPLASRRSSSA